MWFTTSTHAEWSLQRSGRKCSRCNFSHPEPHAQEKKKKKRIQSPTNHVYATRTPTTQANAEQRPLQNVTGSAPTRCFGEWWENGCLVTDSSQIRAPKTIFHILLCNSFPCDTALHDAAAHSLPSFFNDPPHQRGWWFNHTHLQMILSTAIRCSREGADSAFSPSPSPV